MSSAGWSDFGQLDSLSRGDSPIHRLDGRAKVLTSLLFIIVVASFGRYSVVPLLPLFIFPVVMLLVARLPLFFLLRRLLLVAPFVLLVGIFNPIVDQQPLVRLGTFVVSAGWISFFSIVLRCLLTAGMALILIAVTGFPGICHALARLGVPRVFVLQLLFLYRYIFVLGDEAGRMIKARDLRVFHGRGKGLKVYSALLTQLLWRAIDRAQKVHRAMLCRGFSGEIRLLQKDRFRWADMLFILCWGLFFFLVRLVDIAFWRAGV